MKYEHVVNLVHHQPWAILPVMYDTLMDLIAFRADDGVLTQEEIKERIHSAGSGQVGAAIPRQQSRSGAVAVLPLHGVMAQRMNLMSDMSGRTSTELFGKMLGDAVADPAIGGIVLDIDSPGGSVFGVQELWQTVMNARGEKPIIAMANSMAASAAYWVATAADEIVVTPGGQVGSIGVLTAHSDLSAQLEMLGEKVTIISAGKKKLDGNPIEPLSEEARSDLQKRVDAYYGSFVNSVAKGRSVSPSAVRNGFGEGAMVGAEEALKQGMADRIGTLDVAITRAGGRSGFRAEESRIAVFATAYAERSGVTVHDHGRYGALCDCGDDMCDGYQMAHDDVARHFSDPSKDGPDTSQGDADLRERRLALHRLVAGG